MKKIAIILILFSLSSLSQSTLKVRNKIEDVEFLTENRTDSVTANLESNIVNINGETNGTFSNNKRYYFYDNKVIIFKNWVPDKLRKKAYRNRVKFLAKISALKQKKKIEYLIFDATIKSVTINRINYISDGGYAYYQINRTTNDTVAREIILPKTSFKTFFKYSYEIAINGEIFSSQILYNTPISNSNIVNTLQPCITKKIRETIPVGIYDANKAIDKQKLHLSFTEYSYFSNTATLRGKIGDGALGVEVGFNLKDDLLTIESDLPIFSNPGNYNKKTEKIIFKDGSTRITFKR